MGIPLSATGSCLVAISSWFALGYARSSWEFVVDPSTGLWITSAPGAPSAGTNSTLENDLIILSGLPDVILVRNTTADNSEDVHTRLNSVASTDQDLIQYCAFQGSNGCSELAQSISCDALELPHFNPSVDRSCRIAVSAESARLEFDAHEGLLTSFFNTQSVPAKIVPVNETIGQMHGGFLGLGHPALSARNDTFVKSLGRAGTKFVGLRIDDPTGSKGTVELYANRTELPMNAFFATQAIIHRTAIPMSVVAMRWMGLKCGPSSRDIPLTDGVSHWPAVIDTSKRCLVLPYWLLQRVTLWALLECTNGPAGNVVACKAKDPSQKLPVLQLSLSNYDSPMLRISLDSLMIPGSANLCLQSADQATKDNLKIDFLTGAPIVIGTQAIASFSGFYQETTSPYLLWFAPNEANPISEAQCAVPLQCVGDSYLNTVLNVCEPPKCSGYMWKSLDEHTMTCEISSGTVAWVTTLLIGIITINPLIVFSIRRYMKRMSSSTPSVDSRATPAGSSFRPLISS